MSGPVAREIEILLQEAFLPTRLDVINDSGATIPTATAATAATKGGCSG